MSRAHPTAAFTTIDSIRHSLVGLRMPRALEVLDATLRRIEQGEIDGIGGARRDPRRGAHVAREPPCGDGPGDGAIDGHQDAPGNRLRLPAFPRPRTDPGPGRVEVHRPGRGHPSPWSTRHRQEHLALALAVEAVKAGRSVAFTTLADLIASLAKAERDGSLRDRIRYLCQASLLVVDEIGYLPVVPGGGNLFFQLVNARYEKGAMILTSNRGFAEWGEVFGDPGVATALLDRLLHHAIVIQIEGASYRLRPHASLVPKHVRSKALITPPPAPKRRGRPPGKAASDHTTG